MQSSGENFLDDQSLVSGLKEAKAKVFESLNDLVQENKQFNAVEGDCRGFENSAVKIKCFVDMCSAVMEYDQVREMVIICILKVNQKSKSF